MKQVLYIGAGAPWMGGAGYLVRQGMLLRALAGQCRLHLGMFDLPADAPPPPLDCALTPLPLRMRAETGRLKVVLADVFNPLPRMLRSAAIGAMRQALAAAVDVGSYDAVVAFRIDFAHFAGVLGHRHLVLDVDDPEHLRSRRRWEAQGTRIDWRSARDLEKLRQFELAAVRGATHAFVCQAADAALFPSAHVTVVPNGVSVPPDAPRNATPPLLLLLGNFAAGPGSANSDGLRWFMEAIWPLIRAACPAAECRIVGRMGEIAQQQIAGVAGVRASGFVPSLAEAFAGARLSIAPLRFGTGTRIKILDSFAHGCPVVSTTLGAEGLAVTPGRDILIGDTPQDFAAQCIRLLTDTALAETVGNAGRRLVREKYDTATIETALRQGFAQWL